MDATIHLLLLTAIWRNPGVFAGWIEVAPAVGQAVRYPFRAERYGEGKEAEYHFTRLHRLDEPESRRDFGAETEAAFATLAYALDLAVQQLHARVLERFGTGQAMPAETLDLGTLGFQVSIPFRPAGPEAVRVLRVLLD